MANYRVIRWAGLWWCLCVCFLWSVTADAASRVRPPMPDAAEQAKTGAPSRGSGGLSVRGPLHGQYIPYGGPGGRKMHIPVSADYYYSIPRTFNHVKDMFRGGLGAALMGAAIAGIGTGLDWVFDNSDAQWKKHGEGVPAEPDPDSYTWTPARSGAQRYATPAEACYDVITYVQNLGVETTFYGIDFLSPTQGNCRGERALGNGSTLVVTEGQINRTGLRCPDGAVYSDDKRACLIPGALEPITESDISQIDQFQASFDAEWLQDILSNACNGSTNPNGCLESLVDQSQLIGPASTTAPSTTTTTTTTGPDGISGTSTSTTTTTFTITYGPDYYDYSETKTTTTIGPDGTTTTETQQETATEGEPVPEETTTEVSKPCSDNCEGPAYEDMYTPTEDTKESLTDSYLARVQAIPLFAAVGGFFDVSVSASCPVWQTELSMNVLGESFAYSLIFDYHCQPWFVDLRPFCLAVFMIFGAGVAFRIAIL